MNATAWVVIAVCTVTFVVWFARIWRRTTQIREAAPYELGLVHTDHGAPGRTAQVSRAPRSTSHAIAEVVQLPGRDEDVAGGGSGARR
ncbi:hypothetical protein PZ938_02970 [Luteipulveratus sp. YIM 133132]|uniref:hypothetical protein n=1 Tax=Luteipulveratus flavus TaxID=3031728 RepID=UPI0023B0C028|nr:hypothetical protein [Luteipulveratus sp. YIM 133132]MDE9364554.1 hypothetical protein [Luteipulveratus sp. YIM 133132]